MTRLRRCVPLLLVLGAAVGTASYCVGTPAAPFLQQWAPPARARPHPSLHRAPAPAAVLATPPAGRGSPSYPDRPRRRLHPPRPLRQRGILRCRVPSHRRHPGLLSPTGPRRSAAGSGTTERASQPGPGAPGSAPLPRSRADCRAVSLQPATRCTGRPTGASDSCPTDPARSGNAVRSSSSTRRHHWHTHLGPMILGRLVACDVH